MLDNLFTPLHLLILAGLPILVIVPFWQIFRKAGLGGPFSLLMIFPGINIVMLYILAFTPWRFPRQAE